MKQNLNCPPKNWLSCEKDQQNYFVWKIFSIYRALSPKIIGELNGQQVRIAKLQGEFIWHSHALEDELFLVISGELTIELKEQDNIVLREGEMVIIPKGIEHRPVAAAEVWLMLFEPASTINTGEVKSERTISKPDYLFWFQVRGRSKALNSKFLIVFRF